MGKKKDATSGLGKSLIKSRFETKGRQKDSFLHTSELQDGQDWSTNLSSITEQSNLEEFLTTAQMAGRDFTAEKLDIKFVNPQQYTGILSPTEEAEIRERHTQNQDLLRIPRRPSWTTDMSADEVDLRERESFLEWRRELAKLEEDEGLMLTPYERNLEFWRQLWRVIERSDLVVQIVDARNPLLFFCPDLQTYITEVDSNKRSMILVNKSDLLSDTQREIWTQYFDSRGIYVAFWSALKEDEAIKASQKGITEAEDDEEGAQQRLQKLGIISNEGCGVGDGERCSASTIQNSSALLNGEQLITLLSRFYEGPKISRSGKTTVGMVGYPNVGKSSTINALLQHKKVAVSATPGRTKHFQTLELNDDVTLCDCPGLVMPTFVSTKAEMVVSGILPVDQMRDSIGPCSLICQQLSRVTLERTYGINIPLPGDGDDPDRPPTARELLAAHAYMRGYMGRGGQPDCSRSARYIVKDYINGKLLYCHPPPGADVERFQPARELPSLAASTKSPVKPKEQKSAFDAEFFSRRRPVRFGEKGVVLQSEVDHKTHNKRKKKEKLRRVHKDLNP